MPKINIVWPLADPKRADLDRATVRTMRARILTTKAPDCSGAFALEGTIRPSKECQYLPAFFGPTPLSVLGSTLP